jgi:CHAT domain-containing protein
MMAATMFSPKLVPPYAIPIVLAALLQLASSGAAQAPSVPVGSGTPAETSKSDAKAAGVAEIDRAWAALHSAEAAHPGNSPQICDALKNLIGLMLDSRQVNDQTLELARREMAVAQAGPGPQSLEYLTALGEMSEVLVHLDRPAEARPYAEKAFDIARTNAYDADSYSDTGETLAYVCDALGDFQCALRGHQVAVEAARKRNDPDPFDLIAPLSNLAHTMSRLGDHAGAIKAFEESLALAYAKAPQDNHIPIIESNTGAEYSQNGEFDKAILHLNKALELGRKIYGPDSTMIPLIEANMASLYDRTGQFDQSWKYWQESNQGIRPGGFDAAHGHSNYARSLASGGKLNAAIDEGLTGARLSRENFVLALRTLPERQALAFEKQRAHGLDLTISVVARHPELVSDELFQELIRSRAMVADEMAQRKKNLNRGNDPEVARLLRELDAARSALLTLEGTKQEAGAAGVTGTIAQATDRMERAERAVAERSAAFRSDERLRLVALDDVRRNMPRGSLLISYVLYGRSAVETVDPKLTKTASYAAFVFHPETGKLKVFDLGPAKEIDALVENARKTVDMEMQSGGLAGKRNERAYRDAALALRMRIWDPVRAEFAGANLLLVVPDGELSLIPFAAFPVADGYWLDHGQVIHMLSSERDLVPVPVEEGARKGGLVAIGNPAFNLAGQELMAAATRGATRSAGLSCAEFNQVKFHPLPESAEEISDISAQWKLANSDGAVVQYLGSDATRERFVEQAAAGRVLHIATHAFLLSESCGDGNPLLQSGLVFAGANSSRQASLLTAQEIASLDLSGVDWAVLSACNTGNGELHDGEGVLGLQRAFRMAGAKSVILTLWPVDDGMSRRFMHELYAQRFGSRATTADSVWNAQKKLLADQRAAGKSTHPWYWSGFVGSGSWE